MKGKQSGSIQFSNMYVTYDYVSCTNKVKSGYAKLCAYSVNVKD